MEHLNKRSFKKALAALILTTIGLNTQAQEAGVEEEQYEENGIFAALSFGGGFAKQSGINGNLDVNENYNDYLFLNLELRAQWNGFFVEFPGRSQEQIDGQFSGNALGYNFYNSQNWSYDIYAAKSSDAIHYKFSNPEEALEFERVSDFRLGIRATGYFDDLYTQFIIAPHSFRSEIGGIEASASVRQNWQYRNLNIYNSVGLKYRSADILDHYYGVDEALSAEFADLVAEDPNVDNLVDYFSPYEAGGGFSVHGEVGFEYPLSENLVFGGFFQYVIASDEAKNSPLFIGDRVGNSFGLSLTYVF